jgi:eukaryotic-like serine/threonine-protein kinase
LGDYIEGRNLQPKDDAAWRNIADCYAMLGDEAQVTANYAEAARLMAESLQVNPQRGPDWMTLAFYEAKLGHRSEAQEDLSMADAQGAGDLPSQFAKVQVLALLGRKQEALKLLLACLDRGLAPIEVDLALDLRDLRSDPEYRARMAHKQKKQ